MKKFFTIIALFLLSFAAKASHIVGGEIFYKYVGAGASPGTSNYEVSLRLFRDCNVECGGSSGVACLPTTALLSVFVNANPYSKASTLTMPFDHQESISLSSYPVCISSRPSVCYEIRTYVNTITLPDNADGYVISYQNCCRAESQNVLSNAQTLNNVPGATYTCSIPGTKSLPSGHNSSAIFNLKDTSLVCYNSSFTLDFSAVDPDKDSLSYEFASAYDGGTFQSAQDNIPAGPPDYNDVDYNGIGGFSGTQPLGKDVSINPRTGLISGLSPSTPGRYVVNVLVNEWRNGVKIAVHRKDFIMRVEQCDIPVAQLEPSYITCDGFNLSFQNMSSSENIFSYYWDFGDPKNQADTSTSPTPEYFFSDTGTYKVTLITNKGQQCSDTAITMAKVYPGFVADFKVTGSCAINPYNFTDLSTTKYGVVDSWHWDFGDLSATGDTSLLRNPVYQYTTPQDYDVQLIVSNSKGCQDTVLKTISVSDKPTIGLAFRDTLICSVDSVQLHATTGTGTGTFSWVPVKNINNPNIPDPFVSPKTTTDYIVTVNEKGCVNSDTVTVNVTDSVYVHIGSDTTICLTDTLQLHPNSNALYYSWTPATNMSDNTVKEPFVTPVADTRYDVVASIGSCIAKDAINIRVAPYPEVDAGEDAGICFGKTVQLFASINASTFSWSPSNSLLRANTLSPLAGPQKTTTYYLTVTDNKGCPKPVTDSVTVNVVPPVRAFAGHDTTIVAGQPLQLNATGGTLYQWSPATGMSDVNIPNPVVTLGPEYDSIMYTVLVSTPEGCSASDNIKVTIFTSAPDIFIPSAFTPNGDGLNDVIKPKLAGIKQFNYFRIYNRWGNLLFSTSEQGKGWDGTYSGVKQASGTYVFTAQVIDYTGKTINKKGTIVLIR